MRLPLGKITSCAALFYVLAALLLHVLQPERSPWLLPMSGYVHGTGGFLMTMTFFALGLALVAAGLGLRHSLAPSWPQRIGLFLILLAAAAVLVAGCFPNDDHRIPPQFPVTRTGWTHFYAGLVAFPCFLLGPLFLTIALSGNKAWSRQRAALWLVIALLTGSVGWFVAYAAPHGQAGLAQRILLGLLLVWLALIARRITALREASSPTTGGVVKEVESPPA